MLLWLLGALQAALSQEQTTLAEEAMQADELEKKGKKKRVRLQN